MAYLIKCEKGKVQYKYSERVVPYISKFEKIDDGIIIFQGEFTSTYNDLKDIDWLSEQYQLTNIDAPFTIVRYNSVSKTIKFSSSIYGAIQMYYYYENGIFMVSDDFWEIVSQLNVVFDKLDIDSIHEHFLIGYPLFDGTYIKNLHEVNSGMSFEYDIENDCLVFDKYYSFKITPIEQTLEEATKKLDQVLDSCIKRIYAEVGNVNYSMGLSGGLDSRLIPHYALKNNLNLSSYILGEPKPRKIFLSRDHRNARKLASIFKLKHEECVCSRQIFLDNVYWNVKNAPMMKEQFFKGRSDINFEVLLTGGSGYFVGSTFPKNLQALDVDSLAFEMHRLHRAVSPYSEDFRLVNAATRILFGKELNLSKKLSWADKFLDEDRDERVILKIKEFIYDGKKCKKDNLSIFLEWFDFYGARNMFGGYESLSGRVRAFSIYNPHVIKTILQWKYEFFENRNCLKNLILIYIPEVAKIKEQKHEGKIGNKPSLFNKLFNGFFFWLFGNGTDIANKNFKYVKKDFYDVMTNECKWFYRIFDVKADLNDIMKHRGKDFLFDIMKTKIVLDYLETGEYEKFLDKSEFEDLQ